MAQRKAGSENGGVNRHHRWREKIGGSSAKARNVAAAQCRSINKRRIIVAEIMASVAAMAAGGKPASKPKMA
jgi:hypothetical protein